MSCLYSAIQESVIEAHLRTSHLEFFSLKLLDLLHLLELLQLSLSFNDRLIRSGPLTALGVRRTRLVLGVLSHLPVVSASAIHAHNSASVSPNH